MPQARRTMLAGLGALGGVVSAGTLMPSSITDCLPPPSSRSVSESMCTAIRRAMETRDQRCRYPGCESRRCDAHHVRHWADGGNTRLDNLVLLCRRHHRAVHEEGFGVELRADGKAGFTHPGGCPMVDAPAAPVWTDSPLAQTDARLQAAGIYIHRDTATPDWHGERLDVDWAITVLHPGSTGRSRGNVLTQVPVSPQAPGV